MKGREVLIIFSAFLRNLITDLLNEYVFPDYRHNMIYFRKLTDRYKVLQSVTCQFPEVTVMHVVKTLSVVSL